VSPPTTFRTNDIYNRHPEDEVSHPLPQLYYCVLGADVGEVVTKSSRARV
jgi:hypothetical protein